MRAGAVAIALLGLAGAAAKPLLGLPGAFLPLLVAALGLWLVGAGTAAAALAPARRTAGIAALAAALLGWPLLLLYGLAPLWGLLAAGCGAMVWRNARAS